MASSSNRWLLSCVTNDERQGEETKQKRAPHGGSGQTLTDCSFFFAALASSDKSKLLRATRTLVSSPLIPAVPSVHGELYTILTCFLSIQRQQGRKCRNMVFWHVNPSLYWLYKHVSLQTDSLSMLSYGFRDYCSLTCQPTVGR